MPPPVHSELVGALVCVVVALKLGAEASAEVARPTLVVTAEVYLRKGNGLSHQPRIDATMPRGTEQLTADEDPLDGDEQAPLEMHFPEPEPEDEPPPSA